MLGFPCGNFFVFHGTHGGVPVQHTEPGTAACQLETSVVGAPRGNTSLVARLQGEEGAVGQWNDSRVSGNGPLDPLESLGLAGIHSESDAGRR